ncbi:hypothetical protein SAMN02927900_04992 [Rhizobium mongolense subsp. loessense]|uniref:Uncharacterized protein n=1 Tax=Rhizobium mongolense subsp. loessense TaxID=158890 RepID=A0A1G4TDG9_9HYPH|nr:hypothetical protein SAMN02927900_04992 [Rhizobium mongolense subsp. loessense]
MRRISLDVSIPRQPALADCQARHALAVSPGRRSRYVEVQARSSKAAISSNRSMLHFSWACLFEGLAMREQKRALQPTDYQGGLPAVTPLWTARPPDDWSFADHFGNKSENRQNTWGHPVGASRLTVAPGQSVLDSIAGQSSCRRNVELPLDVLAMGLDRCSRDTEGLGNITVALSCRQQQ